MATLNWRSEFESIATNGCIGDPLGGPAYAYIRVSSDEQAEDGRSGLPRQIQNCHEVALKHHVRIPMNMVFAEDASGFMLDRPELDRLRSEIKSDRRRSSVLVIEEIGRLSRNADWHQGFLLDEMKKQGVEVIFWQAFNSRIERTILGAIAQEGMEQSKERMRRGMVNKAKSGRVTARMAAFGYKIVDDAGGSANIRRQTYYAIDQMAATVVREIFQRIIQGDSMHTIASSLNERRIRTRNGREWVDGTIRQVVSNTVYYGKFTANRWYRGEKSMLQRDRSEWIEVDVPAIVDRATWETANDCITRRVSSRNSKTTYLLRGLLRCKFCGQMLSGRNSGPTNEYTPGMRYAHYDTARKEPQKCLGRTVAAKTIELAVWEFLCHYLLSSENLKKYLDNERTKNANQDLNNEIDYLQRQLADLDKEDGKLFQAYLADIYDEQEFAERRADVKKRRLATQNALQLVQTRRVSEDVLRERHQFILTLPQRLNIHTDPSRIDKQRVIALLVDTVWIDMMTGEVTIEGVFGGTLRIEQRWTSKRPPRS